jgi:hypothetical protein
MSESSCPVHVRLLYTEGCTAMPVTVDLIFSVAAQTHIRVNLERIRVESPDQASALRFLGSPTVQVGGLDVEPGARSRSDYGFM